MNETALAIQLGLDFAYQDNGGWQGYARTFDDAMQECQGAARGPLHWSQVGPSTWGAKDLSNGLTYQVEQLPF